MANWYVYSGAAGAGTGADWTNAYTTLKAAAEAAGTAAGDDIWVAHDHAETGAVALTITWKGTAAAPGRTVCVNRAGSVPPVAADIRATASVTTTANNAVTLTGASSGFEYVEGVIFNCGTGAVTPLLSIAAGNNGVAYFKNCQFRKLGTSSATNAISASGTRCRVKFENCSLEFGSVSDGLVINGPFEWYGGTILGATIPTNLFTSSGVVYGVGYIRGCDFSPCAGKTLVAAVAQARETYFINCKLGAATVAGVSNTTGPGACKTYIINCHSGDTNYRTEAYTYSGVQTVETIIVRTGGASDGTTPISWKLVTSAGALPTEPFESLPITVWNDTTGAKTVSLYGYWDNAAVPTNAQIWMVAEYLGTSGFPMSLFASSGPATVLTGGSNIPSDTSTWGGGDTTTRFKMSVPITTAMKGPITVTVYVGVASQTFYVDPKIEVV